MEPLRVGVVGVGYLGRFHAEQYARLPEAQLIGLVDIDESRCRALAELTACEPLGHHHDLIGKVDAVSIAVPTVQHYQVARDFLDAGIHVLVEKPIAASLQEAQALNTMARDNGLIFQVGHLERFNGALLAARETIDNPLYIEARRMAPFTGRGVDVDVVLDLMIHDIDIMLMVVSSGISRMHAVGQSFYGDHHDVMYARISFANGCVANLTANRIAQEKVRTTVMVQSDGYIELNYLAKTANVTRRTARGEVTTWQEIHQNDQLEVELRAFLACIREQSVPVVSGEDGERALDVALRIVDAAHRSVRG